MGLSYYAFSLIVRQPLFKYLIMRLPEKYINRIKELLADDYEAYIEALDEKPYNAIRINNKKIPPERMDVFFNECFFAEVLKIRPVPWINNGFYIDKVSDASAHPFYRAGLYYIQDPSAMTPAANLPVNAEDFVLDMCAAPGGKSSELAARLSEKGFLLANDISASRGRALVRNLELAGADNACVTAEDPQKLSGFFPFFFDKILIDAPCSGEGMFRKDSSMIESWIEKQPEYYVKLQRSLLTAADKMLKPGGMIMYSTCTFSDIENEKNIAAFLKEHAEYKTVPIKCFEGFEHGICGVEDAVRLYPHKIKGEGQFLCLLKKTPDKPVIKNPEFIHKENKNIKKYISEKNIPAAAKIFLRNIDFRRMNGRFYLEADRLFLIKENMPILSGVRYLRTGLFLGRCAKNGFEPSHALALALKKSEFTNTIDLPHGSIFTKKYLKGESFKLYEMGDMMADIRNTDSSWILVCTDGYPIGWAKSSGDMLKNKYELSLRIR